MREGEYDTVRDCERKLLNGSSFYMQPLKQLMSKQMQCISVPSFCLGFVVYFHKGTFKKKKLIKIGLK